MNKIYTITNQYDQPLRLGSTGKTSMISIRWIIYHLRRKMRYHSNVNDLRVHEIDLKNGSVTKCSATAFMESLPQNADKIKSEIKARFGFAVDLSALEALHRANALNPLIREDVFAFLTSKGINL
jgi:hypothetical protein